MSLVDSIDYKTEATNGSFSLTPESNVYYFTATDAITYTYNLPTIIGDGQEFRIYRFDALDTATLTISSTDDIIYQGTTVTSFDLNPSTAVFLVSLDSKWYVKRIGRQGYAIPVILFSGNYRTGGSSYITISSGTLGRFLARFPYSGKSGMCQILSGVVLRGLSSSSNMRAELKLLNSAGNLVGTSGSVIIYSGQILELSSIDYSNLPTSIDYLSLTLDVTTIGAAGNVRVYSFIVYSKEWQ